MRVVSWNVRTKGSRVAWDSFLSFNADVALVQEGVVPNDVAERYVVHFRAATRKSTKPQRWGTAVLVKSGLRPTLATFESTKRPWVATELAKWGACIPVEVEIGPRKILVVSAYVPAWRVPVDTLTESQKAEVRLLVRTGDDIWVGDLLWKYLVDELNGREAIVGGDYNSSVLFDRKFGGRSSGNEEMQDRMTALGFTDLLRVTSPDRFSTPTFVAPRNKKPYQLDFLYATSRLSAATKSCVTGSTDLWAVSDHLPIIADIEI